MSPTIRRRMTHRAAIYRTTETKDAWGAPKKGTPEVHIASQPCYWYQPFLRSYGAGEQQGQRNVNIYTYQLMVPLGTDITERDQVQGVVDRRGTALTSATMEVIQVARHKTHLILTLEEVS